MSRCPGNSVGAIFRKGDTILMLDRTSYPIGWACPAGHMDEGETPEQAIKRETEEETGVKIKKLKEIFHGVLGNECGRGFDSHEWWVYEAEEYEGEPERREPKKHRAVKWQPVEGISRLILDPAWREIFQKLNIINAQ